MPVEYDWSSFTNRDLKSFICPLHFLFQITVTIKPKGNGCVRPKIYRAETGSLPAEFLDGTKETGPKDCSAAIYSRRKGPRSHIEIKICYIEATIIIRQVGEFLTFHVKIAERFLQRVTSTGLCVNGCPPRQQINYRELLSLSDTQLARMRPRRSKMSRKEAHSKCKETKITGFYLDSCLFDLLTTGDKNFSAAAWHALDDSFSLDEMGTVKDLQNYNTTQPREDETQSDPSIKHRANSSNRNCLTWTWLLTLFALVRWQTSLCSEFKTTLKNYGSDLERLLSLNIVLI